MHPSEGHDEGATMDAPMQREFLPISTGSKAIDAPELSGRQLVVVIGIDNYEHQPRLRSAVSDALGLQQVLVDHFGFEAPLPPLTNDAATKQAIVALIEDQLRRLVGPDDTLILFFAGHGTTRTADVSGTRIEIGYLAPVEARGFDRYSGLVNTEELLRSIGLLPARHILVVLDACHSGMALGSAVSYYRATSARAATLLTKRSRRLITSTRADERALDNGPVPGHSLFTGALIQALVSGDADLDRNGVVTSSELALCVQQRVVQESGSRQTPDYGAFHLDDRGELVLSQGDLGAHERRASAAPRDTHEGLAQSWIHAAQPPVPAITACARRALFGFSVAATMGLAIGGSLAHGEFSAKGALKCSGLESYAHALATPTSEAPVSNEPAPKAPHTDSCEPRAAMRRGRSPTAPVSTEANY